MTIPENEKYLPSSASSRLNCRCSTFSCQLRSLTTTTRDELERVKTLSGNRPPWIFRYLSIVFTTIVMVVALSPVHAETFVCYPGDTTCLIAAIDAGNNDAEEDIIRLEAGDYLLTEIIDNNPYILTSLPTITSPITIIGAGKRHTLIKREANVAPARIFQVSATGTLTLKELTIAGGRIDPGGGAAIDSSGGTVILSRVVVRDNISGCGAIQDIFGRVIIFRSRITSNESSAGGGICSEGELTLINSNVSNNFALIGNGGGIFCDICKLTVRHSTISGNEAQREGGGISLAAATADIAITNSKIIGNSAGLDGGGIFIVDNISSCNECKLVMRRSTISGNQAGRDGGGIYAS